MKNVSTRAVSRQIKVPFHGAELYVVDHNGEPYTPMKPIVEGMGLDWGGQHKKLAANQDRWGVSVMEIPSAGGLQDALCLPLRKLGGWLMTVHASRVRAEIRSRIVQYQNECDDVLWQYWNDGIAVNPRMAFSVNPGDVLTADQQETLRLMVKTLVERLPKAKQGGAATRVWSKLKAHFKVPYRQIPQFEFTEAVSIVTRTAAEWDVVDPEPEPAAIDGMLRNHIEVMCSHVHFLRSWWRTFGDGIRSMNNETAVLAHDHFIESSSCASSVGKMIGYNFPVEYARGYPWRGTPQDRQNYWLAYERQLH